MLADLVSGEALLPGSGTAIFSLCPHRVKARDPSGVSFIRALIPLMRAPSS